VHDDDFNKGNYSELDLLRTSLGTAFHRRGLAFQSLGLNEFAFIDLNVAADHNPFDEGIYVTLDNVLKDFDGGDDDEDSREKSKMEQQIFIENLQENFPRPLISSTGIRKLLKPPAKKNIRKESSRAATGFSNAIGGGGLAGNIESLLPLLGSLGGLSPEAVKNVGEIVKAMKETFIMFKNMYGYITKRSTYVVMVLAAVLMLLAFVSLS